jgi:hypothetical protein
MKRLLAQSKNTCRECHTKFQEQQALLEKLSLMPHLPDQFLRR